MPNQVLQFKLHKLLRTWTWEEGGDAPDNSAPSGRWRRARDCGCPQRARTQGRFQSPGNLYPLDVVQTNAAQLGYIPTAGHCAALKIGVCSRHVHRVFRDLTLYKCI